MYIKFICDIFKLT